jgi:hypothetical protein
MLLKDLLTLSASAILCTAACESNAALAQPFGGPPPGLDLSGHGVYVYDNDA